MGRIRKRDTGRLLAISDRDDRKRNEADRDQEPCHGADNREGDNGACPNPENFKAHYLTGIATGDLHLAPVDQIGLDARPHGPSPETPVHERGFCCTGAEVQGPTRSAMALYGTPPCACPLIRGVAFRLHTGLGRPVRTTQCPADQQPARL